jgi:hypothetical protein
MAYATFVTVRDGSIVNYRPLAGLPSGARWNGSFVSPSAPRTPPAEMARTGRRRQRHERGAWRWHRRRRRRRGRPWCPACSCPRAAVAGSGPDVRGGVSVDLAQLVAHQHARGRAIRELAAGKQRALGPSAREAVGRHRACADIVGCRVAALWGETRSGSSARLPRSAAVSGRMVSAYGEAARSLWFTPGERLRLGPRSRGCAAGRARHATRACRGPGPPPCRPSSRRW